LTANVSTLTDRHLDVLAHQVADGVQDKLDACCNCLDVPGLRDVVSSEVYVILRRIVAHQWAQAQRGYQ
jgi:hypothetical protein